MSQPQLRVAKDDHKPYAAYTIPKANRVLILNCLKCKGTGHRGWFTAWAKCNTCLGTGRVRIGYRVHNTNVI